MGVRRLGRILGVLVGFLGATLAAVLAVQLVWPETDPAPGSADAVVCLGAGMSYEGWRLPDDRSLQRALSCAALVSGGAAPVAVFTGHGHEVYSVGEAMADAARQAGLSDAAILVEPHARSTLQNADLSRRLLPERATRVIVVSDAYHLPRAWVIFRLMGFDEVHLHRVPADLVVSPPGPGLYLRETAALWFNAGRIVAYWAGGAAGIGHDTRIGWFN